jgi:aspartyl-tRNA(Asn)/glutamyl-tRNA(Gln) amidotransferase subunit C
MALSPEAVAHVARLARLRLTGEELEQMRSQLSDILEAIALLQDVAVDGVEPTAQVTRRTTVLRPDAVVEGLSVEEALANAPDQLEGMFRVKAIFDI